jgi:hypothetical protein
MELFTRNAVLTEWINKMVISIIGNNGNEKENEQVVDEGDDVGSIKADAARWLMTYLGEKHPDEFLKSSDALGMPMHTQNIDADKVSAMMQDDNIGICAVCVNIKIYENDIWKIWYGFREAS